jgi:hypothetical protein
MKAALTVLLLVFLNGGGNSKNDLDSPFSHFGPFFCL